MKRVPAIQVFLFALIAVCTGCIPIRVPESPQVYGSVFDAANRKPIAGASLYYQEYPKKIIHTSADGRFEFPPVHGWSYIPLLLPVDMFANSHLFVQATGYEPEVLDYKHTGLSGSWGIQMNQIFLLKRK
jgi:hypothetical protein